jgi:hypothetical protein
MKSTFSNNSHSETPHGKITNPIYTTFKSALNQLNAGQPESKQYSVKYLGIVDGSMGILSRKLEMKEHARNLNSSNGGASTGVPGLNQGFMPNLQASYMSRFPIINERKKIIVKGKPTNCD